MKVIDLFFYTAYIFLINLGRSEDNAKWSAFLHVCAFMLLFTITILVFFTIILFQNDFFINLLDNYLNWLALQMLYFVIFYLRYYKTNKAHEISLLFSSLEMVDQKKIKRRYLFNFFIIYYNNAC